MDAKKIVTTRGRIAVTIIHRANICNECVITAKNFKKLIGYHPKADGVGKVQVYGRDIDDRKAHLNFLSIDL